MPDRQILGSSRTTARVGLALLLAAVSAAKPLNAQIEGIIGLSTPIDTASLAPGAEADMETLLEKTFLKVDVLKLRIRFDPVTTRELRRLAQRGSDRAYADSISALALTSRDAWARIHFERELGLSQLIDGILENVKKAWDAGIISGAEYEDVRDGLPLWFGFLEERRVQPGDQLLYRIRGDVMRTIYVTAGGEVLLDQADIGPGPRLTLLGGYFAPGSDLRDGLIKSLRSSVVPHP